MEGYFLAGFTICLFVVLPIYLIWYLARKHTVGEQAIGVQMTRNPTNRVSIFRNHPRLRQLWVFVCITVEIFAMLTLVLALASSEWSYATIALVVAMLAEWAKKL